MKKHTSNNSTHWAQISEAGIKHGIVFLVSCYRLGGKPLFSLFLAPVILYFYFSDFQYIDFMTLAMLAKNVIKLAGMFGVH